MIEILNKYLYLNESGELFWKVRDESFYNGDKAKAQRFNRNYTAQKIIGGKNSRGYPTMQVEGKSYLIHRVIWMLHNGKELEKGVTIDHIDRNKENNNPSNLRLASHQQQSYNKDSNGYYFCKTKQKYIVEIKQDKNKMHIGIFNTELEAKAARFTAEKLLHGRYAKHINKEVA